MDLRTDQLIEQVLELVDHIDAAPDGELITALETVVDRVQQTQTASLAAFVADGRHILDGQRSPVTWLRTHCSTSESRARALAKAAKRLHAWPTLAGLWADHQVDLAQVDTVVAGVNAANVELYAAHDAEVSPALVGLTATDTKTAIADWDTRADALTSPDPTTLDDDGEGSAVTVDAALHLSRTHGDRGRLDADLDPDTTTLVEAALRVVGRPADDGSGLSRSQRRAEALARMARFTLDHWDSNRRRPARQHPHIDVVYDLGDLLADLLGGLGIHTAGDLERFLEWRPVSIIEEGLLRAAFDHRGGGAHTRDRHRLTPAALTTTFGTGTLLSRLVLAEGQVLDQGRNVRFYEGNLRDALLVRDQGCRFPGCDAPVEWVHGHHIRHWHRDHGTTNVGEGAGYCSSHHGTVHTTGWTEQLHPDGTITITKPDGTTLTSPPPHRHKPPKLPLHRPGGRASLTIPDCIDVDGAPETPGAVTPLDDQAIGREVRGGANPHAAEVRLGEPGSEPAGDAPTPTSPGRTVTASPTAEAPGSSGRDRTTPEDLADRSTDGWRVASYDDDHGLPVDGTLGHDRFHITWDTDTPTERRELHTRTRERLAALRSSAGPDAPLAA